MNLSVNRTANQVDAISEAVPAMATTIRFDLVVTLLGCWMVAGRY